MNKRAVWLITCFLFIGATVMAQCNQSLVEKAAQKAGSDAVYIRDFKVKLSEGTMDEPSPTGKFPVYLNKGVVYRFSVANAIEFSGKAFVEISRRDQVYAGNYDFTTKIYSETFDFVCDRSTTYQVLINYGDGKEGCSAIVMSMVLQDSMAYIEPGIPAKSDSAGVIYLFADNQMQIASSAGRGATLEVSISQGTIEQKGQYYIAKPVVLGDAWIRVEVKQNQAIIETDSVLYKVEYPPLPNVVLPDETAGTISLSRFSGLGNVELFGAMDNNEFYILKEFALAPDNNLVSELLSDGNQLSPQQIFMIKRQNPGSKIFIRNITFIDPSGKMHKGLSREILIKE